MTRMVCWMYGPSGITFQGSQLRETTGGEFRVYRASIRYIDLL